MSGKPRVVVLDVDGLVDPSTIRSLIRAADQTEVLVIDLPHDAPGVDATALKGLLRQRHELALAADRPKLPQVEIKLIPYIQPAKPLHRRGPRWVAPAKRKGR